MMEIKELQFGEIPEGVNEFFLIRKDFDGQLILELYKRNYKKEWDCEEIHCFFDWTSYDKDEVLKEAEDVLQRQTTIYVEDETFWEKDY